VSPQRNRKLFYTSSSKSVSQTFPYCNWTTSVHGIHFSSNCEIHKRNYILFYFCVNKYYVWLDVGGSAGSKTWLILKNGKIPWLRFSYPDWGFLYPEVFPCFFLSCKANARVKFAKAGHGPHSSKLVVICVVPLLFVLFYVLSVCKCVL